MQTTTTEDEMLDAAISWCDSNGINALEPEQLSSLVSTLFVTMTDSLESGYVAVPLDLLKLARTYMPVSTSTQAGAIGMALEHLIHNAKAPAAPVVNVAPIVAGALYDFMGWLTSRRTQLVLSDKDLAGPAADAIVDFSKMRGLPLDGANVLDWQTALHPTQRRKP